MNNPNAVIMQSTETLGGDTYLIRVFQTDDGTFTPEAFDTDGHSVYIGGEDDEDSETPEQAIEHCRQLLRDQQERGNLDV